MSAEESVRRMVYVEAWTLTNESRRGRGVMINSRNIPGCFSRTAEKPLSFSRDSETSAIDRF